MNRSPIAYTQHNLHRKKDKPSTPIERIRLIQFMVCLLLALSLFVGKGVFPGKMTELRIDILSFMSRDLDIRGAISRLGESLSGTESSLGDLGAFCAEVFGPQVEKNLCLIQIITLFKATIPVHNFLTEHLYLPGVYPVSGQRRGLIIKLLLK